MQITILDDAGSTAKVVLNGKLDISGAEKIALPLATLAIHIEHVTSRKFFAVSCFPLTID